MSGSKHVDSEGFLYTGPIREQGNIYKPNNKVMADELSEKEFQDVHTKEIDLVNRDPKHLNDEVVKGKIEGKRGPGRRRTSWLQNPRDWFGQNSAVLFRVAADKNKIANMIANV